MRHLFPWKIRHVSVRERCPDLTIEDGVGGLFVVFWCDRVPLGELLLPAAMLPIGSSQLASTVPSIVARVVGHRLVRTGFEPCPASRPCQPVPEKIPDLAGLLELGRPIQLLSLIASNDETESASPSVSVVVCTRNRPDHLQKCLASIRTLSPAPSEVVVVDNDPSSGSTRNALGRFPEVRYVPEPKPGLAAARNAGVLTCSGEIIAFTDDDVIVHSGWVGAIRTAIRHPDVMAVTGLVLPAELETEAQYVFQVDRDFWNWEYRERDYDMTFFDKTRSVGVPAWRIGAGANMAFKREAFDRVGLFDERLGAGAAGCSEDSELWYRLLAEGHRCRYAPTSVVFHYHRSDWDGLREQLYSYLRGHVTALFLQFARYRHWGNLYRAFVAIPFHLARLTISSVRRRVVQWLDDSGPRLLPLPVGPQILGAIAGFVYYVRHRRTPGVRRLGGL